MSDYRFSRRTLIAAIGVLDGLTQAQLSRFILQSGPLVLHWAGSDRISVTKRLNNIIQLLDDQPNCHTADDEPLRDALVDKAVSLLPSPEIDHLRRELPSLSPMAAFLRALELDGYTVTQRTLRRTLPADTGLPEAEDQITRLLKKHRFITPKGHLDQALDAHGRGDWAAANSQLRSFIEGLLDEMAVSLDPAATRISTGHARRAHLANVTPPFLDRSLNEWNDNGGGFINGLMARLHPHGSHPGLSDQEDSTFRLHIILHTARLLLKRFDK